MVRFSLILILLIFSSKVFSQERVSTSERLKNFGIVYGAAVLAYVGTQKATIEKEGSLRNWLTNPFSPRFDNDSFDYNLFQHSLSGAGYYLFYRSQRYQRVDAFLWAAFSSAAFEFTIETVTERPSWQDLYQTPVYGTLLGIGAEKVSERLYETGTWWGKTLAYVTNPFRVFMSSDKDEVSFFPVYGPKSIGFVYRREF